MSDPETRKDGVPPACGGEPQSAPADAASADGEIDLERLRQDLERFRDLAMRSQADFDNYRKRAAREREETSRNANAGLLGGLLPILDSFELGLETARRDPAGAAIVAGMEMVGRQLADFLRAHGVSPVDAEDAEFDPRVHEALAQESSADVPEGRVVRQVRRGYLLHGNLLRPAAVIVSRGPGDPPGAA